MVTWEKTENMGPTVCHVTDLIHHIWGGREGQPAVHLKYIDRENVDLIKIDLSFPKRAVRFQMICIFMHL